MHYDQKGKRGDRTNLPRKILRKFEGQAKDTRIICGNRIMQICQQQKGCEIEQRNRLPRVSKTRSSRDPGCQAEQENSSRQQTPEIDNSVMRFGWREPQKLNCEEQSAKSGEKRPPKTQWSA